ncbi:MAG: hypothetical protein E1N59_1256 [Puniceicoccaceae bacterium 5H]|nr:MAG: hypothetical protein E1N59_1256 [Puniceicoccaceae bacterium 5H]
MLSMEHHFYEYVGKKTVGVCVLLSMVFFVCFTFVMAPHVPDADIKWRMIWGAYTSLSLTGVFFFASIMLSVMMAERRHAKKRANKA